MILVVPEINFEWDKHGESGLNQYNWIQVQWNWTLHYYSFHYFSLNIGLSLEIGNVPIDIDTWKLGGSLESYNMFRNMIYFNENNNLFLFKTNSIIDT